MPNNPVEGWHEKLVDASTQRLKLQQHAGLQSTWNIHHEGRYRFRRCAAAWTLYPIDLKCVI